MMVSSPGGPQRLTPCWGSAFPSQVGEVVLEDHSGSRIVETLSSPVLSGTEGGISWVFIEHRLFAKLCVAHE